MRVMRLCVLKFVNGCGRFHKPHPQRPPTHNPTNHLSKQARARDLFYGLWIPDLFMRRVEEDGMWSLMCPDQCPGE